MRSRELIGLMIQYYKIEYLSHEIDNSTERAVAKGGHYDERK